MQLFTLGLNYQSAPLAIRERVALNADALRRALAALVKARPAEEAAILSTCNRTELYCAAGEPREALAWLADAGYDPVYGARPLKRVIQRALQNPLATMLLEGRIADGQTVEVSAGEHGLMIDGVPADTQATAGAAAAAGGAGRSGWSNRPTVH